MEIFVNVGLGMAGFMIGNLLFAKVGRWLATVYEIAKDPSENSKAGRFASATFLSSGPWFAIAAGMFAYYIHARSWAVWIYVGAAAAIVFFIAIAVYLARAGRPPLMSNVEVVEKALSSAAATV